MSARAKALLCALSIALVAGGTTALLGAAASRRKANAEPSLTIQRPTTVRTNRSRKNFALQPEALKVARQLGTRFLADDNRTSVLVGTLTIGSDTRPMQVMRKQSEDGESVEVRLADAPLLSWDAQQGALASGQPVTGIERQLIERLVFDSPDQFVLMQLRGASYYTVARSVRPADAQDGYDGPLWTIVRVDDPERDEAKKPTSGWRLYYVNTVTGLIDRIESEVEGQRIVAEISSWAEHNGEKVPAQIAWTRDGQPLMQFSVTTFSQSQN